MASWPRGHPGRPGFPPTFGSRPGFPAPDSRAAKLGRPGFPNEVPGPAPDSPKAENLAPDSPPRVPKIHQDAMMQ